MPSEKTLVPNNQQAPSKWRSRHFRQWDQQSKHSGINNQSIVERFYGAGAAKCHHLDNFFEWKKTTTGKKPYAIALANRRLMGMVGLWETWRSPAGERIRSFTIITTTPNKLRAELHNRMPVVLKPETWPVWLGEQPADVPSSRRCSPLPFR